MKLFDEDLETFFCFLLKALMIHSRYNEISGVIMVLIYKSDLIDFF